jgi:predicted acetyltransferase
VTELATPHVRFHRSFLEAVDEFRAAGEDRHDGVLDLPADEHFPGVRFTREGLEDPVEFARLVEQRLGDADPASPRPTGWVPATHRWIAVGDTFVGGISLRHSLDHPFLAEAGGHVGYAVRPGARRRGHAKEALRLLLPLAGAHGLERVLVTCDVDNTASARTIESCGGVLEDVRSGKRRYWVATG